MKVQMLFETPGTIYKLARRNIPEELSLYDHNLIRKVSISYKNTKCLFSNFYSDSVFIYAVS